MPACNLCGARDSEELQVQQGFRILTAEREVPFDIRTASASSSMSAVTRRSISSGHTNGQSAVMRTTGSRPHSQAAWAVRVSTSSSGPR